MQNFISELKERGMIAQITHEEDLSKFVSQPRVAYAGFDPTADSLHVGHLIPLMMLARWQKFGHKAIALMGGATAMVGDPTGKSEMRQMITPEEIARNIEKIRKQMALVLDLSDPKKGMIVNNADWIAPINYLQMLREVGPHFSVNRMLAADCFKSRLEKGLSFLEFNYMILQSYDFLHLNKVENCSIQLGGDDQWSNMLSGVELVRRLNERQQAFCITCPLLTTADGKKMGKTEKGAVWLDSEKTSPYEYFQFWRNLPDHLIQSCFHYFTFLSVAEIADLCREQGAALNGAKKRLAFEATCLIHGEPKAREAEQTTERLFSGGGIGAPEDLSQLQNFDLKREQLLGGLKAIDLLAAASVVGSKGEGRRLIEQGGIAFGDIKITSPDVLVGEAHFHLGGDKMLIRKGKKSYFLVSLVS